MKKILSEWRKYIKEAQYGRSKTRPSRSEKDRALTNIERHKEPERFRIAFREVMNNLLRSPGVGLQRKDRLSQMIPFFKSKSKRQLEILQHDLEEIIRLYSSNKAQKLPAGGWPRSVGPTEDPSFLFAGQPIQNYNEYDLFHNLEKVLQFMKKEISDRVGGQSAARESMFTTNQINNFYIQGAEESEEVPDLPKDSDEFGYYPSDEEWKMIKSRSVNIADAQKYWEKHEEPEGVSFGEFLKRFQSGHYVRKIKGTEPIDIKSYLGINKPDQTQPDEASMGAKLVQDLADKLKTAPRIKRKITLAIRKGKHSEEFIDGMKQKYFELFKEKF